MAEEGEGGEVSARGAFKEGMEGSVVRVRRRGKGGKGWDRGGNPNTLELGMVTRRVGMECKEVAE